MSLVQLEPLFLGSKTFLINMFVKKLVKLSFGSEACVDKLLVNFKMCVATLYRMIKNNIRLVILPITVLMAD